MLPENENRAPLVIVGGGAGAAWALILIKHALGHLPETLVVEPREHLGLGLAYSTTHDIHRLNVTAEKMDMFAEPGVATFGDWVETNSPFSRFDYVPRSLYGRYLNGLLREKMAGEPVSHRRTTVQRIASRSDGYDVILADGETVQASNVIISVGNPPSRPLGNSPSSQVIDDPSAGALEAVSEARKLLVVGAGLTAIDVVLECEQLAAGRHYTIVAPHPYFPPGDRSSDAVEYDGEEYPSPSWLWHWAKKHRGAGRSLEDWYAPVDGLRSHTRSIWLGWEHAQRRTFLRHCARYWLHLRHRAPPESAELIARLGENNQLAFRKGRVGISSSEPDRVEVTIDGHSSSFDCVVNATGPNLNPASHTLLSQMVCDGLIEPDSLGLGIKVGEDGQAGRTSANCGLFLLGTWTRGSLWEVVAVPHIRESIRAMLPILSRM